MSHEINEDDLDLYWVGDEPEDYWVLEIEEGQRCQSCYGTGLDDEYDTDCMICYGEGYI